MKTAEEWAKELDDNASDVICVTVDEIKAIQADALNEAARIVKDTQEKSMVGTTSMNQYGEGVKAGMIKSCDIILSRAEQLKKEAK